jgi:hypothetical protein
MEIEMVVYLTSPAQKATLTAAKRVRFPARYVRKDARTLVLRLAYGPQSNVTDAVSERTGLALGSRDFTAARQTVEETLPLTGYNSVRCRQILADFDRLSNYSPLCGGLTQGMAR